MEVTEQPGPVGDEEEEEDDDAGSVTSNSTTDSNAGGAAGSGKKKKSKKKKKKKGDGNGADGTAGEASTSSSTASSSNSPNNANNIAGSKSKVDKGEADKRFNAALEGARKGDLWVDLSSTAMQTSKAKKLFDSLKSCDGVTSVDLSGNNISDEGAQSIASILGMNGLPALIELDLRDNPLSPEGLKALEGLQKLRKKLFVKTGSSKTPEPEPLAPKLGSKELKDVSKGKMFRKFFQTGDDDDDDGSVSHQESMLDDRGVNPAELWEEIESKQREGALTALAAKLQQLCSLLQREVQAIQSASSNALDGSKPHVKECVANLGLFASCLSMQPRRLILQCSTEPLPAVGSHRVAVAEAVALLASPNNLSLDRAVLGSNLVPQVIKLALQQPLCSLLHVRALQLLRSCLSSSVLELAVSLLQPGWGVELPAWRVASGGRASVAPSGEEDQEEAPEGPCGPLPEVIAETATSAVSVPSGSRSPNMGFVLEVCKVLKAACSAPADGRARNEAVASALEGNDAWAKFSGDGGALSTLLTEQGGDLCGPRPVRPPMDEAAELGEVEGSGGAAGHMSGREILAFLQSMTAMGVIS